MTAAYVELVRVSDDAQDRKRQHDGLDRLRKARPGKPVHARLEVAVSGTLSIDTTEAGRILTQLAERRAFTELRVHDFDRCFGQRSDSLLVAAELPELCRVAGAVIVESNGTVNEPGTFSGRILIQLKAALAAGERHRILKRTNEGRVAAARLGKSPGGRRYYGRTYNATTEQWEYVDVERDAVRELMTWIFDGVSFNEAARRMNAKHVPTMLGQKTGKTAGVWYARTLTSLLRQRHLVGETHYGNKHVEGGPVDYKIPPLMTEAEFQRLQQILDGKRPVTRTADPSTAALCLGRVYCPCGARLYRKSEFYFCSSSHTTARVIGKEPCPYVKYQRVDAVDGAAWEAIVNFVSRDMIAEATETAPDVSGYQDEIARCEKMLADLEDHEAWVNSQCRRGKMSRPAGERELDTIASNRTTLERTLKAAQQIVAQAEASQMSQESIAAAMAGLRSQIRKAAPADRKALLHALIPDQLGYGIVVHPDGRIEINAGIAADADAGAAGGGSGRTRRAADRAAANSCNPARRITWRRNKCAANPSTRAPISMRSARSRITSSRGGRRSRATTRSRSGSRISRRIRRPRVSSAKIVPRGSRPRSWPRSRRVPTSAPRRRRRFSTALLVDATRIGLEHATRPVGRRHLFAAPRVGVDLARCIGQHVADPDVVDAIGATELAHGLTFSKCRTAANRLRSGSIPGVQR